MINIFLLLMFFSRENVDWTINGDTLLKDDIYGKTTSVTVRKFSDRHLRTGDIIYRKGFINVFGFDFSQFTCDVTESKFSHCGVVEQILGRTYVFECRPEGFSRVPLGVYLNESVDRYVLVQRITCQYNYVVKKVINYCWTNYMRATPYDYDFVYGGNRLYCAEAIVRAFAEGKIFLASSEKVGDLPGVTQHMLKSLVFLGGTIIYGNDMFSLEKKIVFPGNSRRGIIASKKLHTVFEGQVK